MERENVEPPKMMGNDQYKDVPSKNVVFAILYGSQTGTANDLSERVVRQASRYYNHMDSEVSVGMYAMDDGGLDYLLSLKNVQSSFMSYPPTILFVVSTTGQGDCPDNMKMFWRSLCRKNLSTEVLSWLRFGLIGLGDSSYAKYNFVGKKLFRRLVQLGGLPVLDMCLGDDQHDLGFNAAVNPWLEAFWKYLIPSDVKATVDAEVGKIPPISKFVLESKDLIPSVPLYPMEFRQLIENVRRTDEDHFQDVRLITFDLSESAFSYEPGDVLNILPENSAGNINRFFELFPYINPDEAVTLTAHARAPWAKIPHELVYKLNQTGTYTWRNIVTHLLDIQSVPRKPFFEILAFFCEDELEKEKLEEFCRPEGQEEFFNYCSRPKRNILEVLEDFPNATSSMKRPEFLFDMIPFIKPRSFSIASSMVAFPNCVQILVAVVNYKTAKLKAPRLGLCSNWLKDLRPKVDSAWIWITKGSFIFPQVNEDVIPILVGPGTGCAPFRSFISTHCKSFASSVTPILFFGCRNPRMDFFFEDEWRPLQDDNLLHLFTAFSRPSPSEIDEGKVKTYVQHQIEANADFLKSLIIKGHPVAIFVAGNAKQMPIDVLDAFKNALGKEYVDCMLKSGAYQTEVWS